MPTRTHHTLRLKFKKLIMPVHTAFKIYTSVLKTCFPLSISYTTVRIKPTNVGVKAIPQGDLKNFFKINHLTQV